MEAVKSLFESDPTASRVDLSGQNIESLDQLLAVLGQFESLNELVLRGNSLTGLPDDLSSIRHVTSLDLSNNPFVGIEVIIDPLQTIDALEELFVDLKVESDKDLLQLELTHLLRLNGETLTSDFGESLLKQAQEPQHTDYQVELKGSYEASEEVKGSEANLSVNSGCIVAEQEPASSKSNQEVKVEPEEFQIEQHQFTSLSNEEHHVAAVKQEDPSQEVSELKSEGPLKPIQEVHSYDEPSSAPFKADAGLEHSNLAVKAGEIKTDFIEEDRLRKVHDFSVLQRLPLDESEKSLVEVALMASNMSKSDYTSLVLCLDQLESKDSFENGKQAQHALKTKFEVTRLALKGLISPIHSDIAARLSNLLSDYFEAASVLPLHTSPTKSDHLSINTETAELLEELERENFMLKQDREEIRSDFEQEKLDLHAEIDSLQQENRKYLDTIIKHSKANADNSLSKSISQLADSPQRSMQTLSQSRSFKALTLKQLRDVIEEIYTSKAKFDQRCIDSRQPRETLEQHMHNFLTQKYGLKKLSLDWAAGILAAVQRFASEDNDVAVFGKVLKNQCDEEFCHVQRQVKDTIAELLKVLPK